jgi:chromosomal replication initiation ATPase DnaA
MLSENVIISRVELEEIVRVLEDTLVKTKRILEANKFEAYIVPDVIVEVIEEYFGFKLSEKRRKSEYVRARMIACKLMKVHSVLNHADIAKIIYGDKDHSKVSNMIKEYDNMVKYPDFIFHVSEVKDALYKKIKA